MTTPALPNDTSTIPDSTDAQVDSIEIEIGEEPQAAPETGAPAAQPPPVAAAPAAPTPPAPAPALDDATRQRLAYANQLEQQQAVQALNQEIDQRVGSRYQKRIRAGWPEEFARDESTRYREDLKQYSEHSMRTEQRSQAANAKRIVAEHFAAQYKVPVDRLMKMSDPESMEEHAKLLGEMEAQKTQVSKLTKDQVPGQEFATNRSTRAGRVRVTAGNIDNLWVDFDTQHPDRPNPYDAAYRRFLATGRLGN